MSATVRVGTCSWADAGAAKDGCRLDGAIAAAVQRKPLYLVNRVYAATFPVVSAIGGGRTVGFTDWTHAPGGARLGALPV